MKTYLVNIEEKELTIEFMDKSQKMTIYLDNIDSWSRDTWRYYVSKLLINEQQKKDVFKILMSIRS